MSKTDWPYDASQNDPLTAKRIPVTTCLPSHPYLVAFDCNSDERPTDTEADVIASYIEWLKDYRVEWMRGYQWPENAPNFADKPFDIDPDMKTAILYKYGPDDWAYRHDTWRIGPFYLPDCTRTEALTLLQVLGVEVERRFASKDAINQWEAWKAAHPNLFA